MGFLKKWKQYRDIKKIVKDVEKFEEKCKSIKTNVGLKVTIDKLVDNYNKKNDVNIPQELVDVLYKLGRAAADGQLKNGDLKKQLVMELVKTLVGIVGKIAEYLIAKAVLKV